LYSLSELLGHRKGVFTGHSRMDLDRILFLENAPTD
jgi:hypothetical protein